SSRMQYGEFELTGPYFPGKLIGDRVWIYTRPEALAVLPRNARPGVNQIPAELLRVVEKPRGTRLEFTADIAVETPHFDTRAGKQVQEWLIEFPPASLAAL